MESLFIRLFDPLAMGAALSKREVGHYGKETSHYNRYHAFQPNISLATEASIPCTRTTTPTLVQCKESAMNVIMHDERGRSCGATRAGIYYQRFFITCYVTRNKESLILYLDPLLYAYTV